MNTPKKREWSFRKLRKRITGSRKEMQKEKNAFTKSVFKQFAMAWRGFLISICFLLYAISALPGHTAAAYLCGFPFVLDWNLRYVRKVRRQLRGQLEHLKHEKDKLYKAIELERSERILSFVRRESSGKLPTHCLLLLSLPRSGSTWLFDALRCHPCIFVEPRAIIFDRLGLEGGRYPKGLLNGPDATIDVEVEHKKGAQIPDFSLTNFTLEMSDKIHYAIEKIHPELFNYDVKIFFRNIKQLEQKDLIKIKLIYQIRDPKAAFTSFLNYQKRDPYWYRTLSENKLTSYMERAFDITYNMARQREGLVVDYSDMISDSRKVLINIYKYLWSDDSDEDDTILDDLANAAVVNTERQQRMKRLKSPFFGSELGPVQGGDVQYSDFFEKYSDDIIKCYDSYNALLQLSKDTSFP